MNLIFALLKAFFVGGLICLLGQILLDNTQLTPARILVGYVSAGVLLGALGVYQPLVDWAGAGATVPLTGFGCILAEGAKDAVAKEGLSGALTGALSAGAGGVTAAVLCGLVASVAAKPREK